MDRRAFLGAAAACAESLPTSAAQAIDGGTPVRAKPLRASYFGPQFYDEKERQELLDVVETGRPFRWYGPGKEPPRKVATFEKQFAARIQTKYALAVTSGSAALQVALAALGVGPGDEVILPAWAWYSCYNAIVLAGALPVFAEIDDSLNIDPSDLEARITPQTRCIMPVHLLGCACDMDPILALARKRDIKVLEDCAQSLGATYRGRSVGSLGDIGMFSMQINKTITAGEGGALTTNDPLLFERASRFHDLGLLRPPHAEEVGGARLDAFAGSQFRMNEFSGGVLLAQLRKLDAIVQAVRTVSSHVHEGIRDLPGLRLRHRPDPEGDLGSYVYLAFESQARRDRFIADMKAENVPAGAPAGSAILPVQPHIERKATIHPDWPSFSSERGRSIRYGAQCCPRTIDIHGRLAGVALDPKFTESDADDIVAAIRKVYLAMR
ncbi:MAG TPA: DegT/DnrJ/EryC1/StrS family aminotransferase [Isosphaeraceae bacterium]|jgi:8-amino-3,8-dideoxy-alpha-D-manno-octulosonate transaminase|nr:DegT/DnrJ/EryC1/StrS family aminotransferase [Isosphaeraceae bacterium]